MMAELEHGGNEGIRDGLYESLIPPRSHHNVLSICLSYEVRLDQELLGR